MEDGPGNFLMIGLHKLAAERGDGLIPELLALYSDRARQAEAPEPMELAGQKAGRATEEASTKTAGNDNVIQFRPYLLARRHQR